MDFSKISELFNALKSVNSTFYKVVVSLIAFIVTAVYVFLLCTSCSIVNRSSASGTRQVKKQVEQTYEWEIPSDKNTALYRYTLLNSKYSYNYVHD